MIKNLIFLNILLLTGCYNRPGALSPAIMSGKIVEIKYQEKACKIIELTVLLSDSSSSRSIYAGVKTEEVYNLAEKMLNQPVVIKAQMDKEHLMINCAQEITSIELDKENLPK